MDSRPFDWLVWKAQLLDATPPSERETMARHADFCERAHKPVHRAPAQDEPLLHETLIPYMPR